MLAVTCCWRQWDEAGTAGSIPAAGVGQVWLKLRGSAACNLGASMREAIVGGLVTALAAAVTVVPSYLRPQQLQPGRLQEHPAPRSHRRHCDQHLHTPTLHAPRLLSTRAGVCNSWHVTESIKVVTLIPQPEQQIARCTNQPSRSIRGAYVPQQEVAPWLRVAAGDLIRSPMLTESQYMTDQHVRM